MLTEAPADARAFPRGEPERTRSAILCETPSLGAAVLNPAVVLIQPPHAKACEPTPGLPALACHLRRQGFDVRLVDANLAVQEALLSSAHLAAAAEELEKRGAPGAWVTSGRRISRRIEAPGAALRDPATYCDPRAYRTAVQTLQDAYRLVSRQRGFRISISDLECGGISPLSTQDLRRVAMDPEGAPLERELAGLVAPILAESARLIGISVIYLSQALPAFTLAGLLRRAGYDGVLVLGGGLVSSWAAFLTPESEIFNVWDAVVVGPGEEALEDLARDPGRADAPGLLMPSRGVWRPPRKRPRVCFDVDPAGLPWQRYFSPGPILPLATSRGCYWRRCAFCPETAQDAQPYQAASPRTLARSILRARDALGFQLVHLTDDAVAPNLLRGLARELRGQGVRWYGFARLERQLLDPRFAEQLALGGCAMLQIGVETASQRLLDLLGKGTRADWASAALANLRAAGIRTYVYLLFGAPSETEHEAGATIAWTARNAGSIDFLNLSLMNLPRGSPLEQDPARYGLASLRTLAGEKDLSLYVGFSGAAERGRWDARRTLSQAKSHPDIRPILARTPPGFTSNHAAFVSLR